MHAVLNIHSKIFFAFVFFRGHEFDAHFLGTARDRLLKLKITGLRNGRVSKALEHLCELKWLLAQGDHVEKEIEIFCTARFFDGELHGLGSGDDKVLGRRPESVEKFEKVGALGFGNHTAIQRGAIAFSRR